MGRRLVVEADGGSRGNPGPAGYGAVVKDADSGAVLAERAAGIGRATNNVAEYGGLIAGLTAALDLDADAVEVRMDSKLVVEQMSGRWQVKHPSMKPLAREATDLVRRLGQVRFTWIPRAQNSHADRLANEAMDAAQRGGTWQQDPAEALLQQAETQQAETQQAETQQAETQQAGTPRAGTPRAGTAQAETPQPEPGPPRRLEGWSDPSMTPTTTLLLRHGQTPLSVDKRFSGTGDPALTDTGRRQAAAAAVRLATSGATAVVSSPLQRARETAALVAEALGLDVEIEEDLRETDFGDWEGYTFGEVRATWPAEMDDWLASTAVAPPYGESFDATALRVGQARDRVLARHGGATVVLVSHVTPIKTLLRFALDAPPSALYRMHLDLACLSEVRWYADGPAVVRSLNDTAHLDDDDAVPGG